MGIIPAYAGNTSDVDASLPAFGDHPRVCGEHTYPYAFGSGAQGSSPRMRGTHSRWKTAAVPLGIIPAYAGNTYQGVLLFINRRDHPRVCGEHLLNATLAERAPGSSPRMRGTPNMMRLGNVITGIIPAYAGNTSG